jgi:hypothetical protein
MSIGRDFLNLPIDSNRQTTTVSWIETVETKGETAKQ